VKIAARWKIALKHSKGHKATKPQRECR